MTRAEKVAEAQRLRADGLKIREIVERMGTPRATVGEYLSDPDLTKHRERRLRYGGNCVDCGKPTTADSPGNVSARCLACAQTQYAERNARIFAAWEQGESGGEIAAREGMAEHSVTSLINTYRRRYGMSLSLHRRPNRELWPLIERRWHEGATIAEIAAECGITPGNASMMIQTMRKKGVDLPYRSPRKAPA